MPSPVRRRWNARALNKLGAVATRSLFIADIIEILVGQESPVFGKANKAPRRDTATPDNAHLSLTLVLVASLPPPPSAMDDAERAQSLAKDRKTLDLSFVDEGEFGCVLAAFRTLLAERKERPAAYPSPVCPVHVSAVVSLQRGPPPDATPAEMRRDRVLKSLVDFFDTPACKVLVGCWWLTIIGSGATFAIAEFVVGARTPGGAQTAAMAGIHTVTACLTIVSFVTAPWRLANAIHLLGIWRPCHEGLDFYGRPTTGIWFHLPIGQRRAVVAMLLANTVWQWFNQLFRWIWASYDVSQRPGSATFLLILLSSLFSLFGGVGAGVRQGLAELVLRKVQPGMFPPTPFAFALEAWARERKQWKDEVESVVKRTATRSAATAATSRPQADAEWNELSHYRPQCEASLSGRRSCGV